MINVSLDQEFQEQLEQFLYEGYAEHDMSERAQALEQEAEKIENLLEMLLQNNEHAGQLFRAYQDNRCFALGETSSECYEKGFSNGIKFMMTILK